MDDISITNAEMTREERYYFDCLELKRDIKACQNDTLLSEEKINALRDKMAALYDDYYGFAPNEVFDTLLEILNDITESYESRIKSIPKEPIEFGINADDEFPARMAEKPLYEDVCSIEAITSHVLHLCNAMILCSPFVEELEYAVECYAYAENLPIRVIDIDKLISSHKNKASEVFDSLLHCLYEHKELVVYKNFDSLMDNPSFEDSLFFYIRNIRQKRKESGTIQLFLVSTSKYALKERYEKILDEQYPIKSEDYIERKLKSLNRLEQFYIPLPTKYKTFSLLDKSFSIRSESSIYDLVEKKGVFLGYRGICKALSNCKTQDELISLLSEYESKNKKRLDDFLSLFGNPSTLNAIDWGYSVATPKIKEPEVSSDDSVLNPVYKLKMSDLDSLMGNPEIQRKLLLIMNYKDTNISMLAKCGWIVDFAMKGGDMLNIYNLPPEKAESILIERWNLAHSALASLFHIDVGVMTFDIPEKSLTRGICSGYDIRMNERYIKASPKIIDEGMKTLLHECYHALQHKAIEAKAYIDKSSELKEPGIEKTYKNLLQYYLVHFGISLSHIEQWADNEARYCSSEKNEAYYRDQIVEAEARIFADDCISMNSEIDHPIIE